MRRCPLVLTIALALVAPQLPAQEEEVEIPKVNLPGFKMELFAGSDLIKQPIGITTDKEGRVLAIQSNTHFRPENYEGPEKDRILWLKDTDGDGKADETSVFYEGFEFGMDIATHPETGAIYVAGRNEIFRLWDRDGDGVADPESVERPLAYLTTDGDHPHNALSGLAFDSNGDLYFGMGENYGAPYVLRAADGTAISEGGEGGNIFWMSRDGAHLRRVATGFWNPFGVCITPGDHLFATDNDPSSRPPCRLHYIIEGGNHGYLYRYGRSGHHPFVAWNGEITGTLPMLAGTGEAPCDVFPMDVDAWTYPVKSSAADLLVASWSDHRVGRYRLSWENGLPKAEFENLVQGGVDFRPVAFAWKEGSLYISDWVKRDYQLHNHGRVWKLSRTEPAQAPESPTGPVIEPKLSFTLTGSFEEQKTAILEALLEEEPYQYTLALNALAGQRDLLDSLASGIRDLPSARQRIGVLLAYRKAAPTDPRGLVPELLQDPSAEARLLAMKWIADLKLERYRPLVEAEISQPDSPESFHAAITTLARLDGLRTFDEDMQKLIAQRLFDKNSTLEVRAAAFMILENRAKKLKTEDLLELLAVPGEKLRLDVIQTLAQKNDKPAAAALLKIAQDTAESEVFRGMAIVSLSPQADTYQKELLALTNDPVPAIQLEATRALTGTSLSEETISELEKNHVEPEMKPLLQRISGKVFTGTNRPTSLDAEEWLTYLDSLPGKAGPAAGRRVFFNPKVTICATCHRVEGHGLTGGPDLTSIGERGRVHILESILEPSKEVAPQFEAWNLQMSDGSQITGFLVMEKGKNHIYADVTGREIEINSRDIVERKSVPVSLMPPGLVTLMTDYELRDLVAYLASLK